MRNSLFKLRKIFSNVTFFSSFAPNCFRNHLNFFHHHHCNYISDANHVHSSKIRSLLSFYFRRFCRFLGNYRAWIAVSPERRPAKGCSPTFSILCFIRKRALHRLHLSQVILMPDELKTVCHMAVSLDILINR